jgi:excinuclease UvrABC nuclease subunit
MFMEGKSGKLISSLKREMASAAKKLDFEEADNIKKKIFALTHVADAALLGEPDAYSSSGERIEGYDISDISGDSAVGSMVVFTAEFQRGANTANSK